MRWFEARSHCAHWRLISIENISALWQFPTARYIFFARARTLETLTKCVSRLLYCVSGDLRVRIDLQSLISLLFLRGLFLSELLKPLLDFVLLNLHHQVALLQISRQGLKLVFSYWFFVLSQWLSITSTSLTGLKGAKVSASWVLFIA